MGQKSKQHRKKVASRNASKPKQISVDAIMQSVGYTGMATPNQAREASKVLNNQGRRPSRVFQRKSGS